MLIMQKHLLTGWFHCLTCSRKDSQESREICAAVRFVSDDFFSCFVHERLRFPLLRVPKSSGRRYLPHTEQNTDSVEDDIFTTFQRC